MYQSAVVGIYSSTRLWQHDILLFKQSWKAAWGTLFWRPHFDKISCLSEAAHQLAVPLWSIRWCSCSTNRSTSGTSTESSRSFSSLPPFLPFFLFFYCTVFHWQCGTSSGGKQKNHRGDCWIMQTAPQKKPLSSVFGSILLYFSLLDSITVSSETALSHTLSLLSLTALLPSVDFVWLARIDPAHRQIWIGLKSMAAPLSCSCDRAQSPHRNMWAACCAADAAFKQSNWLFAPWDHPIRRSKMAKTN